MGLPVVEHAQDVVVYTQKNEAAERECRKDGEPPRRPRHARVRRAGVILSSATTRTRSGRASRARPRSLRRRSGGARKGPRRGGRSARTPEATEREAEPRRLAAPPGREGASTSLGAPRPPPRVPSSGAPAFPFPSRIWSDNNFCPGSGHAFGRRAGITVQNSGDGLRASSALVAPLAYPAG